MFLKALIVDRIIMRQLIWEITNGYGTYAHINAIFIHFLQGFYTFLSQVVQDFHQRPTNL